MVDDKKRIKQLSALGHATFLWRRGVAPPRWVLAQMAGVMVTFALLAMQMVGHWLIMTPLAVGAGFCAWAAVLKWSKASISHSEQVDKLLALYEPADKSAYRSLQIAAHAHGGLTDRMVQDWLVEERAAIDLVLDAKRPRPVLKFLSREI